MKSHHRKSFRDFVAADLDIMPLMNLFVVLIPMLLLSAVFVQVSTLDMQLPPADQEAMADDEEPFSVEVTVQPQRYRVEASEAARAVIDRSEPDADVKLREALAAIRAERLEAPPLTILSPADLKYQDLITVMDIGAAAGMGAVSLGGTNEP
jgi:biopolymer transport protein ExbD